MSPALRETTPAPINLSPAVPSFDAVRAEYYNPILDPRNQAKMTEKMQAAVDSGEYIDNGGPLHMQAAVDSREYMYNGGPLYEPNFDHPANLLSSLHDDGFHRPALDVDIEMVVRPSKTPGHCHVEFPTLALTWVDYCNLLDALATAGIVEHGYVRASKRRGQTLLRTPAVPLGEEMF